MLTASLGNDRNVNKHQIIQSRLPTTLFETFWFPPNIVSASQIDKIAHAVWHQWDLSFILILDGVTGWWRWWYLCCCCNFFQIMRTFINHFVHVLLLLTTFWLYYSFLLLLSLLLLLLLLIFCTRLQISTTFTELGDICGLKLSSQNVRSAMYPPKGGRGCLMSPPPCLESQGCHLIPLCYLLLPSPVTLSVWSFSACWPFLLNFFQKILQYFSFRDRLFCMAPV